MALTITEAFTFIDACNYSKAELEIIYGNEPKVKNMKVFDRLLDKCTEKYDDWDIYFHLLNKYDLETGEMLDRYKNELKKHKTETC